MSDKPSILVVRRGDFLTPHAPLDSELIRAYPAGKPLKLEIRQPRRSNPQLRLYWALLKLVSENISSGVSPEALHEWLKMRLSMVEAVPLRSGRIDLVPRSVAFDKMEHAEFTAYFDQVKQLIRTHLIPNANSEAFEREAMAMIGDGEMA